MENLNGKGIIQHPSHQRAGSWKLAGVNPPPPPPAKPKLLDRVRLVIRTRHYSFHTEKAYVGWMKRFIFFHNKRHPEKMGIAAKSPSVLGGQHPCYTDLSLGYTDQYTQ